MIEARYGEEGIQLFQTEKIDAVILDYWMSGMKGTAVATEAHEPCRSDRRSGCTGFTVFNSYSTPLYVENLCITPPFYFMWHIPAGKLISIKTYSPGFLDVA